MPYGVRPSPGTAGIYMPLVHFVLFKTTLRKTFWPYMKILSKKHQFTPSRTSISFSTLISFIPLFFFYFIHLYFTIFCFISFPSASFRYISHSFRFISHSFRLISHSFHFVSIHFASFRILVGPVFLVHCCFCCRLLTMVHPGLLQNLLVGYADDSKFYLALYKNTTSSW